MVVDLNESVTQWLKTLDNDVKWWEHEGYLYAADYARIYRIPVGDWILPWDHLHSDEAKAKGLAVIERLSGKEMPEYTWYCRKDVVRAFLQAVKSVMRWHKDYRLVTHSVWVQAGSRCRLVYQAASEGWRPDGAVRALLVQDGSPTHDPAQVTEDRWVLVQAKFLEQALGLSDRYTSITFSVLGQDLPLHVRYPVYGIGEVDVLIAPVATDADNIPSLPY